MKEAATIEKNEKAERSRKKFIKELKESIEESNEALRGERKLKTLEEAVTIIENTHGGRRSGAGRKAKSIKKVTHGVKLTAAEYNAIIKKYGSFAKGVRTLIPQKLAGA